MDELAETTMNGIFRLEERVLFEGGAAENTVAVETAAALENALENAAQQGGEQTIRIVEDLDLSSPVTVDLTQDLELILEGEPGTTLENGMISFRAAPQKEIRITLDNLTFTGTQGNAVFTVQNLDAFTVRNCTFTDNRTDGAGGAVLMQTGTFLVEDSLFSDNRALSGGGALALENMDSITITRCAFEDNMVLSTSGNGGAVLIRDLAGPAMIRNSTFYNNLGALGGGMFVTYGANGGSCTVMDCTFTGNEAVGTDGGAIHNGNGNLTIQNTLVVSNGPFDLFQGNNGSMMLEHTLFTGYSYGRTGIVSIGSGSVQGVTAADVFGNNVYDRETHTIQVDPFHPAAWSGVRLETEDQLGVSRDRINTELGLTGKYTIGAVTARAGVMADQQDYTAVFTGDPITPVENLTLTYADGTPIENHPVDAVVTPEPSPVIAIGTYVLTPSQAQFANGATASFHYQPGTLTVLPAPYIPPVPPPAPPAPAMPQSPPSPAETEILRAGGTSGPTAVILSIRGVLLAEDRTTGNIYTMSYPQLVTISMCSSPVFFPAPDLQLPSAVTLDREPFCFFDPETEVCELAGSLLEKPGNLLTDYEKLLRDMITIP
ncbi:MAG: right-handed parallel beta-helix repeat-containing protein [Lentisphaerae bacterium]|nr:right-handed parallel beta-helix repeat-containing protein [Lentisphaerota bacterium]